MARRRSASPNHSAPSPDTDAAENVPPSSAGEPQPRTGGRTPNDLLVPYVLLAVSLQRAHGYLIEEYLKGLGFVGIDMSTLYRTLRQLEKDGLLLSAWEPGETGPARRVYSLTDIGRAWLSSWIPVLEGYRTMIDRFFDLYIGGFTAMTKPTAGEQPEGDKERG